MRSQRKSKKVSKGIDRRGNGWKGSEQKNLKRKCDREEAPTQGQAHGRSAGDTGLVIPTTHTPDKAEPTRRTVRPLEKHPNQ